MIVFRADTECEPYDVDYWAPDNSDTNRIRMKALVWKDA